MRCRQEPGSNIALPEDQGHATPPAMAQPSGKVVREPGSCPHREHSASKTAKQKTPPSARKAQKPHPTISRSPRIFYKKCPFQNTSHAEFSSLPRIETGSLSPQETGNVEGATGPPACRTRREPAARSPCDLNLASLTPRGGGSHCLCPSATGYSTEHSALQVLSCRRGQNVLPSRGRVTFHCGDVPRCSSAHLPMDTWVVPSLGYRE